MWIVKQKPRILLPPIALQVFHQLPLQSPQSIV